MTRPVPLMFIKSPSAFVRLPIVEVETELSIVDVDVVEERAPEAREEQQQQQEQVGNVLVAEQLKKIQTPFGRHLYQPLLFKLTNERKVLGKLKKVEGNQLAILVEGTEEKIELIQVNEVVDIFWRGTSLQEQ